MLVVQSEALGWTTKVLPVSESVAVESRLVVASLQKHQGFVQVNEGVKREMTEAGWMAGFSRHECSKYDDTGQETDGIVGECQEI